MAKINVDTPGGKRWFDTKDAKVFQIFQTLLMQGYTGEEAKEIIEREDMKIKYPIGGYAPGHYMGKCVTCNEEFTGDKYARQCEPCAINTVNESNTAATTQLKRVKRALKDIKDGNKVIDEFLDF